MIGIDLVAVFSVLGIYLVYYFIRVIRIEFIKMYAIFIASVLFIGFLKEILIQNYVEVVVSIFKLGILWFAYKRFLIKDMERKNIFKIIRSSKIKYILVNGITDIDKNKITIVEKQIKEYTSITNPIRKINFGVIGYDDNIISIDTLFWNKSDMEKFLSNKKNEVEGIKMDVESISKGCIVHCKISI